MEHFFLKRRLIIMMLVLIHTETSAAKVSLICLLILLGITEYLKMIREMTHNIVIMKY